METVKSSRGVPIRLTDERWRHITTSHPEMSEYYHEILETVGDPSETYDVNKGAIVALRKIDSGLFIVVIYKVEHEEDGFIITSFITSKPETFRRGDKQ